MIVLFACHEVWCTEIPYMTYLLEFSTTSLSLMVSKDLTNSSDGGDMYNDVSKPK